MSDDVNFKHGTQAEVICDSISPSGDRLTTLEVVMHRFVLAEFNTHRVFSRNSASSRAIPFRKQVARVMKHPAIPVSWPAEQRGMQGGEELTGKALMEAKAAWFAARDAAVEHAQAMHDAGEHKSYVNRILEPFMWHTVIVTATDWDGFFEQRCHKDAQPEIRVAAEAMRYALNDSTPQEVGYGQWHMPYIDGDDYDALVEYIEQEEEELGEQYNTQGLVNRITYLSRQVSAARCARVSYLTHDGKRSIEKDLELYARLVERDDTNDGPIHWSPLEHVASPAQPTEVREGEVLGNFTGWHQLRHWRR